MSSDRPNNVRPNQGRKAQFESFEQRLVLSAQALTAIVESAVFEPQLELDPATLPAAEAVATYTVSAPQVEIDPASTTYGFTGGSQTVAVIDTGIAWDHYALGGGFGEDYRVVGGWDFAENDANPYDDGPAGFHGTHVAGIIGSSDAEHSGVASDVDLVALRVFDDYGRATLEWVEQALQWVHDNRDSFENPITTVNLSIGTDWNSDNVPEWSVLEDEIAQLEADGLFISVAAGNSFAKYQTTGLSYPAASSHVVPVASIGADGEISDFSQRNDRVIAAPGESIESTIPNHLYGSNRPSDKFLALSGTSMAAPYVAGASVVVREAMEFAGYEQIDQAIINQTFRATADTVWDSATGSSYLSLNLDRAIESVLANATEPVDGEQDVLGSATDLGTVSFAELNNEQVDGENWYRIVAANDGLLSLSAHSETGSDVQLAVFDPSRIAIGNGVTTADGSQLTIEVAKGEAILVKLTGNASDVELNLSNQVELQDGLLRIHGGQHDDQFALSMGDQVGLSVNGFDYSFDASQLSRIRFDGGGGSDQFALSLDEGSDRVSIVESRLVVRNDELRVIANDVDSFHVSNAGGEDRVRVADSNGNMVVAATADQTTVQTSSADIRIEGVSNIRLVASGQQDSLRFYGSSGDDRIHANDARVAFFSGESAIRAIGFESISIDDRYGGNDRVVIDGSESIERVTAVSGSIFVQSGERQFSIQGIENIFVDGNGGANSASLYTSTSDEYWIDEKGTDKGHTYSLVGADIRMRLNGFTTQIDAPTQFGFLANSIDSTDEDLESKRESSRDQALQRDSYVQRSNTYSASPLQPLASTMLRESQTATEDSDRESHAPNDRPVQATAGQIALVDENVDAEFALLESFGQATNDTNSDEAFSVEPGLDSIPIEKVIDEADQALQEIEAEIDAMFALESFFDHLADDSLDVSG